MPGTFEDTLRHMMILLGRLVEKIIGEAHKAKVSVGGRGGIRPIISLEGQLGNQKIRDMVLFATERVYFPAIPNLKEQAALEIGEEDPILIQRFLQNQAKTAVNASIGSEVDVSQGSFGRGYVVKSSAGVLPFKNDFFNYVGARFMMNLQGDLTRTIREISRVLAPGGQGAFIDFHPFGLYAKKGLIKGMEDYYKMCRAAGLRIIDLREAFIDESFRAMFDKTELQSYRNIKGTPLVVFVFFFKPRAK